MERDKEIHITALPRHEKSQQIQGASYVFSYRITIQNFTECTIQLVRRHWFISDGIFGEHEVEGEGVIGQMPTLAPLEKFEYESWCPVSSEFATMSGYFTFHVKEFQSEVKIPIPPMVLLPQFVLN
jgi:ApaG protein